MKLVKIKWIDSCSPSASVWTRIENLKGYSPEVAKSVGYVIGEDKTCITIAAHVSEGGSVSGVMCIPKVAIIKRVTL